MPATLAGRACSGGCRDRDRAGDQEERPLLLKSRRVRRGALEALGPGSPRVLISGHYRCELADMSCYSRVVCRVCSILTGVDTVWGARCHPSNTYIRERAALSSAQSAACKHIDFSRARLPLRRGGSSLFIWFCAVGRLWRCVPSASSAVRAVRATCARAHMPCGVCAKSTNISPHKITSPHGHARPKQP